MEVRDGTTGERIPVLAEPYNAETPLEAVAEPITPDRLFFVRSHFSVPSLTEESWTLRLGGACDRPFELDLDELRSLPARELAVTLECAGNGRTLLRPTPAGAPWRLGAVATAIFGGTPLSGLLDRMGLSAGTVEILFRGADSGAINGGRVVSFERSLPLEVARDPDTLVVWAMNGKPLRPEHGAPVRLVVPGLYAVASVKWLVEIAALTRPFEGHFQATNYRYFGSNEIPEGTPVGWMRPRALIARPADGDVLPRGLVEVEGAAWSGALPIERVELSIDGGRSWTEAHVARERAAGPRAAVPWRGTLRLDTPGAVEILARATDRAGAVQPLQGPWNRLGYGNNAAQSIRVRIL